MAPIVTLDPVYAAYTEETKKWPKIRQEVLPLSQVREMMNEAPLNLSGGLQEVLEEDITVKHNGTELRLTLFRPMGTEDEILPVVIFYHGGGYLIHCKNFYQKPVRDICVKNHVAVVYPNLSLAPENKYPKAIHECFETLRWVVENGDSIKVDPSKIAVCGESSGATMCATVPFIAKEHGLAADVIKAQILLYPSTAPSHENFESAKLYGDGDYFFMSLADIEYIEGEYFGDYDKAKIRFLSMATREELSGFPPALIITVEADIFRDEAEQYGRQLTEAGVATTTVRIIGAVHGYLAIPTSTPIYKQTMALITGQLEQVFGKRQS